MSDLGNGPVGRIEPAEVDGLLERAVVNLHCQEGALFFLSSHDLLVEVLELLIQLRAGHEHTEHRRDGLGEEPFRFQERAAVFLRAQEKRGATLHREQKDRLPPNFNFFTGRMFQKTDLGGGIPQRICRLPSRQHLRARSVHVPG